MWPHIDKEHGTGVGHTNSGETWPRPETLKTLAELNEQCLELLTEQAALRPTSSSPMLRDLDDMWRKLDAPSRRRAAACPYLLVDAGFADPYRWRWSGGNRVGDREPAAFAAFFTVAGATKVARQVFNSAWYLVRAEPLGSPLFLGMPAHCAGLLRACTLRQIAEIGEQHSSWLRPRWPGRPRIWRELLLAAIANDGIALERARLQGVQMLAAELRTLERLRASANAAQT